jgi:hypothetical protein
MLKVSALAASALLSAAALNPSPARAGDTEEKVVASCALVSATPVEFATCTGSILTANEVAKCFASNFKDCFGENNEINRLLRQLRLPPIHLPW